IPPNSILLRDSAYALCENLFHESLHQQLAASLLHADLLATNYWSSEAPRLEVPWRGGAWEPDRVLHAIYVYMHLLPMRMEALERGVESDENGWLNTALREGASALRYLLSHIESCSQVFSERGLHIFETLRREARDLANGLA